MEDLVAIDASNDVVEVETTLLKSGAFGVDDTILVKLRVPEVDGKLVADTLVDIEVELAIVTSDDVLEVKSTLLKSGAFGVDNTILVKIRVPEVDGKLLADTLVDIEVEVVIDTSDNVLEVKSKLLESGAFGVDDVVLVELRVSEVD